MTVASMKFYSNMFLLAFFTILTACGGGGGGDGSSGGSATLSAIAGQVLGGTAAGLPAGQSLTLSDGTEQIILSKNGTFSFETPIQSLAVVRVTVGPSDGTQCEISDATNPSNATASFFATSSSANSIQVSCGRYPAFHPTLPQVTSGTMNGIPTVYPRPIIVPVFFVDTPNQAARVSFLESLIGSTLWTVLQQYGVGAATVQPAISLGYSAPTELSDAAVRSLISANASTWAPSNGMSPFFLFYIPSTTKSDTINCGEGYHSALFVGQKQIPYALMTGCGNIDRVAQHELMEGSADPLTNSGYAKLAVDQDIWALLVNNTSVEIGDLCETLSTTVPDLPGMTLQPIWSNAAAAAGRPPCQISDKPTGDYFGAVPQLGDILRDSSGEQNHGVVVPAGSSVTIPIRVFSDVPLSTPIHVSVSSTGTYGNPGFINPPTFTLDHQWAHNGDVLQLTISSHSGAFPGMYAFAVYASQGGNGYAFPGGVSNSSTF